ncbi:MAG: phage holin family protein [Solirubrobacteraceae bacterium]
MAAEPPITPAGTSPAQPPTKPAGPSPAELSAKPAPGSLGAAVSEVSERMSLLVREEIELAKAEVGAKVASLTRGAAAVAAGAVFGVFALIYGLQTAAWAIAEATGYEWIGFGVIFAALLLLAAVAFLFAWRKLKVGAPTPKMAIDEAKKIRTAVSSQEKS